MWYEAKAMLLIPRSVSLPLCFSFILRRAQSSALLHPKHAGAGRDAQAEQPRAFSQPLHCKNKGAEEKTSLSPEEYLWVLFLFSFLGIIYILCRAGSKFLLPFSPKSWLKVLEVEDAMGILLSPV